MAKITARWIEFDENTLIKINDKLYVKLNDNGLTGTDIWSAYKIKSEIDKAISGLDFQSDVLDIQIDDTLDPTTSPNVGDRYIITDSSNLNSNFGTIDGLENNDIVEYTSSGWVVAYDISIKGSGVLVWVLNQNKFYRYDGISWNEFGGLAGVTAGDGLYKNGDIINVGAGDGIIVNADSITIKSDTITSGDIIPVNVSSNGIGIDINLIFSNLLNIDGSGSGLDADLLDGLEASAFALTTHNHSLSNLSDVDVTGIGDGYTLLWDATNLKWIVGLVSSSGGGTATDITTDTTNFSGILTTSETNVQLALDKIDDSAVNKTGDTLTGDLTIDGAILSFTDTSLDTRIFQILRSVTYDEGIKFRRGTTDLYTLEIVFNSTTYLDIYSSSTNILFHKNIMVDAGASYGYRFYGSVTKLYKNILGLETGNVVIGFVNGQRVTSGNNLELSGGTSSAIMSVQDGNGRIQLKWNATNGTGETFLVGSENAGFWEFDPSNTNEIFVVRFADGSTASAGDAISWEELLKVGTSTITYKGFTIWSDKGIDEKIIKAKKSGISSITYNTDGSISSIIYNTGVYVNYTYNTDGSINTSVWYDSDNLILRTYTYTYNTDGSISNISVT